MLNGFLLILPEKIRSSLLTFQPNNYMGYIIQSVKENMPKLRTILDELDYVRAINEDLVRTCVYVSNELSSPLLSKEKHLKIQKLLKLTVAKSERAIK